MLNAFVYFDFESGVVLSASSSSALKQQCEAILNTFESAANKKGALFAFEKVCVPNAVRSNINASHVRLGFVSNDPSHMVEQLNAAVKHLGSHARDDSWTLPRHGVTYQSRAVTTSQTKVAALFSGQGSQYVNMFDTVAMHWPTFRNSVVAMDKAGDEVCGTTASSAMYPREGYAYEKVAKDKKDTETLGSSLMAQPTTVACSVGTYDIFTKAGFSPDFCAGHSLGEVSALYASGALDIDTLCKLVWQRAKTMSSMSGKGGKGGMAAIIGKDANKINITVDGVWMANMNSPKQVVITGEKRKVEQQGRILSGQGFKVVSLNVGDAFHSPHMKPAADEFARFVKQAKVNAPSKVEVFSNVTGKPYSKNNARAVKETLSNHMVSSVRFIEQVEFMYARGARVFVEFGPRSTLTKLAEQILASKNDKSLRFIAVNSTTKTDSDVLLRKAAVELCVAGVGLNNFDPWAVEDQYVAASANKKRKTQLRLSAATYVAKSTKTKRAKILNDGFKLSGNVVAGTASSSSSNGADALKMKRMEAELNSTKRDFNEQKINADQARKETDNARQEIASLKRQIEELQRNSGSKSNSASTAMVVTDYDNMSKDELMNQFLDSGLLAKLLSQHAGNPMAERSLGNQRSYETRVVPREEEVAYKAPAPVSSGNSSGASAADATRVVMEVLAAKTGYDVEMIEDDMELETELGIDSIKRVEILSEVQSQLNVEAQDVDALSRTRTVGEVIAAMINEINGGAGGNSNSSAPAASNNNGNSGAADAKMAMTVVMEVLAAKTGYDVEMIEDDMELETELGIDSIKRVEILSEVQSRLNVEAKDVDALSRTRTVGEVIMAMQKEIAGGSSSPAKQGKYI